MDEGSRSLIKQGGAIGATMALWDHPTFGNLLSAAQPLDPPLNVLRRYCLGIHPDDVAEVDETCTEQNPPLGIHLP
mgnify:CR=1 FL=1